MKVSDILLLILLLCVGCSTTDTIYTEKVKECLEQMRNLNELGFDNECVEIQNEWDAVVKRELDKEIKAERVVLVLLAFDYYSLKYLSAYNNFNHDDVDYTMVFNRIKFILKEHEDVAILWVKSQRNK